MKKELIALFKELVRLMNIFLARLEAKHGIKTEDSDKWITVKPNGEDAKGSHVLIDGDTWEPKTWNGLTGFYGQYIWTDGTNTYYSNSSKQYVLNGDTWKSKTWTGLTTFDGRDIWTDGSNYYHSSVLKQYVFS